MLVLWHIPVKKMFNHVCNCYTVVYVVKICRQIFVVSECDIIS